MDLKVISRMFGGNFKDFITKKQLRNRLMPKYIRSVLWTFQKFENYFTFNFVVDLVYEKFITW